MSGPPCLSHDPPGKRGRTLPFSGGEKFFGKTAFQGQRAALAPASLPKAKKKKTYFWWEPNTGGKTGRVDCPFGKLRIKESAGRCPCARMKKERKFPP